MKKLLIIEDDEILLGVLSTAMAGHFEIIEEGDVKKALRRVLEEKPDVVLTDVALPGHSGIDISRIIRCTKAGGGCIPVILMSGGTVTNTDLCKARTKYFIQKPFDLEDLRDLLNEAAADSELRDEEYSKAV